MGSRVGGALVEANAGDETIGRRTELESEFHRGRVAGVDRLGHLGAEDRVGGGHVIGDRGGRRGVVGAVVHRADPDRLGSRPVLHVGVAPRGGSGGHVPRGTVGGDLDASHDAPDIGRRSRDGDARAVRDRRAVRGRGHRHGRRCRVRARRAGHEGRVESQRLRPHVSEQIDLCLLHPRVGRGPRAVMCLVETPGPLDRPGGEDERSARSTIQGEVVSGRSGQYRVAVIL